MSTSKTTKEIINKPMTLAKASIIAGLGLLTMVLTVPVAEFYIFPKLIGKTSIETTLNILNNKTWIVTIILLHFITVLCDVIVAWALYIFLKPVNKQFSLLIAWFRLIYAAMYLIALANLLKIVTLIKFENQAGLNNSIEFYLNSFKMEWEFGLLLFGIYLLLLGYLVFKAVYIPKIFGILLLLAGIGYVVNTVCIFLFPTVNTEFLMITFFGEIIFMFWLLIKGSKLRN